MCPGDDAFRDDVFLTDTGFLSGVQNRAIAPILNASSRYTLAAALLVVFALVAGALVDLDQRVAEGLHDAVRDSSVAVDVLQAITFFGTSLALYTLVGLAALVTLIRRRPRLAMFIIAVSTSGGILNHLLKDLVGRDRPSFPDPVAHGGGPSFPSGHAMNSAIAFGAVLVVLVVLGLRRPGTLAAVFSVVVVAIGFTRMALGVHYLSDVVAGWLIALVWIPLVAGAFDLKPEWRHGTGSRRRR